MGREHRKVVNTDGEVFSVCDFGGSGKDILFIHGSGHNSKVWRPVADLLRERFHVVALDLRGHGQTHANSSYSEQYWMDIQPLIEALHLQNPVLVGHSTGGYAVCAHAASGGDCSSIVVVDGFVPDDREASRRNHEDAPPESLLWEMFRYGWKTNREEMEDYVTEVCANAPDDFLNAGIEPELIGAFTRGSFLQIEDGLFIRRPTMEKIEVVSSPDVTRKVYPSNDIYDLINVPVTLVLASNGLYADRRSEIESLAAAGELRHFYEIEGGHNIHMQSPSRVVECITATSVK